MPIPPKRTGLRPNQSNYDYQMECHRTEQDPDARLRLAGIPPEHADMDWDDYDHMAAQTTDRENPKLLLRQYSEWLVAQIAAAAPIEGLTLLGPPGLGKSLGMALVAKEVCLEGGWVKWTSFEALVQRERALNGLSKSADSGDPDAVNAYNIEQMRLDFLCVECDLLVLDDVGQEYRTASRYGDTVLHRVTRQRSAARKATLITSNLLMEDWSDYSESMASFLYEVGDVLTLVGKGRNQRKARTRGWRGGTR